MSNFYPDNYQEPKSSAQFLKVEPGKTKVRMLSQPVFGWLGWPDGEGAKPVRKPADFALENQGKFSIEELTQYNISREPHFFMCMIIWNYKTSELQAWEISQRTIRDQLDKLIKSESWGSPLGYDLTIEREGQQLDTKYQLIPSPPTKLTSDIDFELAAAKYDLERIFDGEYPFYE